MKALLSAWLVLACAAPALAREPAHGNRDVDDAGDPLPAGASARLGTVRLRHEFMARSAVFSPDGKLIASGGMGRFICLWDARTGALVRRLGPMGQVSQVTFSPDGNTLAAVAGANVMLFDVVDGKESWRSAQPRQPQSVAFSPDSKLLATCGQDPDICVWERRSGKLIHHVDMAHGSCTSAVFSQDGKMLVSGGSHVLCAWETATWRQRFTAPLRDDEVYRVTVSADGRFVASLGGTESGAVLGVRLWDLTTRQRPELLKADRMPSPALAFSPRNQTLAVGNRDGSVELWDVSARKRLRCWTACGQAVSCVSFSPDGQCLLTTGLYQSALRIWDLDSGREMLELTGHQAPVHVLTFLPDGRRLLSVSLDRSLREWDVRTRRDRLVCAWRSKSQYLEPAAFSSDGQTLATWSDVGTDADVRATATGKVRFRAHGTVGEIHALAISADGACMAVGGRDGVEIWDLKGQRLLKTQRRSTDFPHLAFMAKGTRLAVAEGSAIQIHEAPSLRQERRIEASPFPWCLTFSPDGRCLAAGAIFSAGPGSANLVPRLWDSATGVELPPLRGGQTTCSCLTFSPDSALLASGGTDADGQIHLWGMKTRREVGHFGDGVHSVNSLAFSPDGKTLASGHGDSTILLWDVSRYANQATK